MKRLAVLLTVWLVLVGQLSTRAPAASLAPVTVEEDAQAEKLISAVLNGTGKEGVEQLLKEGLNVNSRLKPGVSVYQAAVLRGDTEAVAFLAEHGAITNAPMPSREALADALFTRLITNNGPGA